MKIIALFLSLLSVFNNADAADEIKHMLRGVNGNEMNVITKVLPHLQTTGQLGQWCKNDRDCAEYCECDTRSGFQYCPPDPPKLAKGCCVCKGATEALYYDNQDNFSGLEMSAE